MDSKKKLDTKGISFGTFLMFFTFALVILVSLWFLQSASLKPFYRSVKVNAVEEISDKIKGLLNDDENFAKELTDLTYNNSVCLSIYDQDKEKKTFVNGMGLGCYIGVDSSFNEEEFLEEIDEKKEANEYVTDERFADESLIYGKKIKSTLGTYYIIIDAIVEPVDSTVFIMRNQFFVVAIVTLLFSVLLAWIYSRKLSKPITQITSGAKKMSEGDYSVNFHEESFTEINDLAQTLNVATNELSKAETLQKELLANVSHDIKTPLTTIKAYAEMIEDISGDNPKKRNEHLEVIISETNHLNKLVNDMLTLSKVETGQYIIEEEAFDIVSVTIEVINILKESATYVTIETNFPEHAVIYGDKSLLRQVIYNFLNNAMQHVGDDKKVIINITPIDVDWKIEVVDHGKGISKEELPYIWDRYYKANKNYQREQTSSGLGLAICKAYLDAHKFKYGCISKEGKGSKFYFIAKTEKMEENK